MLLHPPPVLNVLLLDTTNMLVEDQMYLRYQLTQFLQTLKPGEQLAIYQRNGVVTVQLQGFTADHNLLSAGIRRGLPRFMPTGREYLNDADTLHQLALFLGQLPGRKNVLWFSGGSTAFLLTGVDFLGSTGAGAVTPDLRRLYDELETSRIAVYPIDAWGLGAGDGGVMAAQHMLMNESAEATGGHAFYSNNGLAGIAANVVETDGSFYTLTYSPHDFHPDKKWHKVRISVDGDGYRLSYRRGYFAEGNDGSAPQSLPASLFAGATTSTQKREETAVPLIFEARVVPERSQPVAGVVAAAAPLDAVKKGDTPLKRKGTRR